MKDDLESGGIMSFSDLKLFALSSNQELAQRVARRLDCHLGNQLFVSSLMERFK